MLSETVNLISEVSLTDNIDCWFLSGRLVAVVNGQSLAEE